VINERLLHPIGFPRLRYWHIAETSSFQQTFIFISLHFHVAPMNVFHRRRHSIWVILIVVFNKMLEFARLASTILGNL